VRITSSNTGLTWIFTATNVLILQLPKKAGILAEFMKNSITWYGQCKTR
jgi:hypothetical protein